MGIASAKRCTAKGLRTLLAQKWATDLGRSLSAKLQVAGMMAVVSLLEQQSSWSQE
jgi:hypothetical protein